MTEQWDNERLAFTRAFAGAAVFGIPLVYTMEMWWIGKSLPITHLLAVFALGLLANFGLAHVAGFRKESSLLMSFDQAVDALAVGILLAAFLLFGMNQLRPTDGLVQGVGTVILLALPLSLGASAAREVFEGRVTDEEKNGHVHLPVWKRMVAHIGATAIGGVFIGLSIAPTDEVTMVTAGITRWHLFLIIGLSLLLSYLIVFASGFARHQPPGPLHHAISETVFSYAISLVVAILLLIMLERVRPGDPLAEMVRQTIVLALPVSIGGAAGRLVI